MAETPLLINEYHYGGMGIRGARAWDAGSDADFLTSEGLVRADGNHSLARWVDIHGTLDGSEAGLTVLGSPDNFRAPQPVRLHPSMPYFCFAPMVLGEFTLAKEDAAPYVSRYRLWIHDGPPSPDEANRLWNDYAAPPKARIVPSRDR